MHDAAMVPAVKRSPAMQAADVVPHDEIVQLPFVAVDELRLCRPLEQLAQQSPALFDRPADDVGGVGADEQHFSPVSGIIRTSGWGVGGVFFRNPSSIRSAAIWERE